MVKAPKAPRRNSNRLSPGYLALLHTGQFYFVGPNGTYYDPQESDWLPLPDDARRTRCTSAMLKCWSELGDVGREIVRSQVEGINRKIERLRNRQVRRRLVFTLQTLIPPQDI